MPEGSGPLVLYAGWEAEEVEFEVFIWGEYDGTGEYEVKYSYKDKLPAGTLVTEALARQNYAENVPATICDTNYYVLNEEKSFTSLGGSVKGDGSSIYNIYFDQKSFTIVLNPRQANTMQIGGQNYTNYTSSNPYSFTAKIGQNLDDLWPSSVTYSQSGRTQNYFHGWIWPADNTLDSSSGSTVAVGSTLYITKRHTLTESMLRKDDSGAPNSTTYFRASYSTSNNARTANY